jgi:hypothetical protein
MKLSAKNLLWAASLAGGALTLTACGGGYVSGGGSVAVVDTDYYGGGFGGPIGYGHPYYREDSHPVGPPRAQFHGGGASHPAAHSAPAGHEEREHK